MPGREPPDPITARAPLVFGQRRRGPHRFVARGEPRPVRASSTLPRRHEKSPAHNCNESLGRARRSAVRTPCMSSAMQPRAPYRRRHSRRAVPWCTSRCIDLATAGQASGAPRVRRPSSQRGAPPARSATPVANLMGDESRVRITVLSRPAGSRVTLALRRRDAHRHDFWGPRVKMQPCHA